VRGLYRLDHLTGDAAEAYERLFFATVDNTAKDNRDILLERRPVRFDDRSRSAWARFVLGLLFRNPERIAATRKYIEDFSLDNFDTDKVPYDAQKGDDDPEYLDYLVRQATLSGCRLDQGHAAEPKAWATPKQHALGCEGCIGSGLTLFQV